MSTSQDLIPDIERWLDRQDCSPDRIEALIGDVSLRRYFRIFTSAGSSILSFYPPALADSCRRFLETGTLLEEAGVAVPKVLISDPAAGFIWLEDLGPETLYDHRGRPWSELWHHFLKAIDHYRAILGLDVGAVERLNPRLDGAWLDRELDQTFRSLLVPSGFFASEIEEREFRAYLSRLCHELGEAPSGPCHRDYMARNLVPVEDRLVVIDHQDLRIGPRAYDLASLLNDSLYPPPDLEEIFLATSISTSRERHDYHLAAVQRTLKAVGTFASFAAKGHPRHLTLIRPTLERTLMHLDRLQEGRPWAARFRDRWMHLVTSRFPGDHS